jgi:hypothetical protein
MSVTNRLGSKLENIIDNEQSENENEVKITWISKKSKKIESSNLIMEIERKTPERLKLLIIDKNNSRILNGLKGLCEGLSLTWNQNENSFTCIINNSPTIDAINFTKSVLLLFKISLNDIDHLDLEGLGIFYKRKESPESSPLYPKSVVKISEYRSEIGMEIDIQTDYVYLQISKKNGNYILDELNMNTQKPQQKIYKRMISLARYLEVLGISMQDIETSSKELFKRLKDM